MTARPSWLIRRLVQTNLAALRPLRLEALRAHPEAFGATVDEEERSDTARLIVEPPGIIVGGFAGEQLIASAGLMVYDRSKQRHVGHVFGFYVKPEWRGAGIGDGLLSALINHANTIKLRSLTLSVTIGNAPARNLYRRAGFLGYGIEPDGLVVAGVYYDLELMVLKLDYERIQQAHLTPG
jgi:ribosomal protein S18 acetylase RimI-like enzyme